MDFLPENVVAWLQDPPTVDTYRSFKQLQQLLDQWSEKVDVRVAGFSRGGLPIRVATIGEGPLSLLAWGYPHPDEPLGSETLCWLGQALIDQKLTMDQWTVHLVLCADPDEMNRQAFLDGDKSLWSFVQGCWRPQWTGLEVDYGFPMDQDPFWQDPYVSGRSRQPLLEQCLGITPSTEGPWGALPESVVLSHIIEETQPDVLGLMHSTHTGGDYTFVLQAPSRDLLQQITGTAQRFGLARHLGPAIDAGDVFDQDFPDVQAERPFEWYRQRQINQPWYDADFVYHGPHAAGAFAEVEALHSGRAIEVLTPESTQFQHKDFGNVSASNLLEVMRTGIVQQDGSTYKIVEVQTVAGWQMCQKTPTNQKPQSMQETLMATTSASLGVQAIFLRKQAMHQARLLWQSIESLVKTLPYHPFLDEVHAGDFHCEKEEQLLMLQSQNEFHSPATCADVACWRWLWPIHTAATLGNFQCYIRQSPKHPELAAVKKSLDDLQRQLIDMVPVEMHQESHRPQCLQSIAARLLLTCQQRQRV